MRVLWIPLILLLALPARAADKTELIRLRYTSATELNRVLQPDYGALRFVVPAGILVWTADARRNAFSVTGSEEGIREFKTLLRILDVPAVNVRVLIRVFRLDEAAAAGLKDLPSVAGLPEWRPLKAAGVVEGMRAASLEALPVIDTATVDTNDNTSVVIRETGERGRPLMLIRVRPRVNGDGTVALFVSTSGLWSPSGPVDLPAQAALRRLSPGQAVVLLPQTPGPALMIRLLELQPPIAP